ncbi:MAG: RimK family protein [Desulfocapsaceae bacterium]|nr:RimK family protein [Desulfocapsaceae bacterium]
MSTLIVVDNPRSWPLALQGVEIIPARSYLTDPYFNSLRRTQIFNMCKSYRYQAAGYYVSLLAEARGHKPIPSIWTIQDMKLPSIIRFVSADLDELIQSSLAPLQSDRFVLSIYFGKNMAKRYDRLSSRLFNMFYAPFLRANFVFHKKWILQNISPIAGNDIPDSHLPFVMEVANAFFARQHFTIPKKNDNRFDLAILYNPEEKDAPSNERALKKFIKAAAALSIEAELIRKEDFGRLSEFDALFIRETTNVNHHTYRFARRAAAEGLVVLDDPESILRCTNKVFLAELFERHKIRTPKTMIVHRDNLAQVEQELGLPCILKKPDSSFSQGVSKAKTKEELMHFGRELLNESDLIIAQQFLPTPFDWRIGVLDKKPLFACKYFMATNHWQIIQRASDGTKQEGNTETFCLEDVPEKVLRTAVKAANLIGDGLYGVDLKEIDGKVYLIEINDNPNLDAGNEDAHLKDGLYTRVMASFLTRIERKKRLQAQR